jgi:hypothetical protein
MKNTMDKSREIDLFIAARNANSMGLFAQLSLTTSLSPLGHSPTYVQERGAKRRARPGR